MTRQSKSRKKYETENIILSVLKHSLALLGIKQRTSKLFTFSFVTVCDKRIYNVSCIFPYSIQVSEYIHLLLECSFYMIAT